MKKLLCALFGHRAGPNTIGDDYVIAGKKYRTNSRVVWSCMRCGVRL